MTKPIIKGIARIKGLGILADSPPPPAKEFRKYNLIYGFNGSGKTTLSRVFASLQHGSRHTRLPQSGSFEIELSDGAVLKSGGDLQPLVGRIFVFNGDFQEENLKWKEGTASPIFYIGREQAELISRLENAEREKAKLKAEHELATARQSGAENAFNTFRRDIARRISEEASLGRKYDATNLTNDYASFVSGDLLDEKQLLQLKAVSVQTDPLPKRKLLVAPISVAFLAKSAGDLLETTLGESVLADLAGRDSMYGWIRTGLDYHRSHELESCLFCGNELTDDRSAALSAAIDSKFDDLVGRIADTKRSAGTLEQFVTRLLGEIPSPNDISPQSRALFEKRSEEVRAAIEPLSIIRMSVEEQLSLKTGHPNQRIDRSAIGIDQVAASTIDRQLAEAVSALNRVIEQHNESFDNFASVKAKALEQIKHHYLRSARSEYLEKESEIVAERMEATKASREIAKLATEIEQLNRDIRSHGPPAQVMTKMIHNYLGRDDLEISAIDSGYQLIRNGVPVKGALSEGEKTAIALCYFFTTLEAEGRKRKDLIVVVDDPVSSLDTKALNYSASLIKSVLGDAAQLILLTHNLNFMNEVKKWLKNMAKPRDKDKDPTASLLFLDSTKSATGTGHSSVLIELPKYIREYESEYHYLLHLILRFSQPGRDDWEAFYVIPNALRKVLDTFLAFKIPGNAGLADKIASIAKMRLDGIDPVRIQALDRLAQVESHADSLEDLVAFSSMTVEEAVSATEALLALMKAMDEEHFTRISKICA